MFTLTLGLFLSYILYCKNYKLIVLINHFVCGKIYTTVNIIHGILVWKLLHIFKIVECLKKHKEIVKSSESKVNELKGNRI